MKGNILNLKQMVDNNLESIDVLARGLSHEEGTIVNIKSVSEDLEKFYTNLDKLNNENKNEFLTEFENISLEFQYSFYSIFRLLHFLIAEMKKTKEKLEETLKALEKFEEEN